MSAVYVADDRFDPFACVDSTVTIGERSRVWQFASVIRNARIGEDCNIGSCAIVDGAVLEDRVSVGHGAFICPGVLIMSDVFIGPGVMFCNDAWPSRDKQYFDLAGLISGKIVTILVGEDVSIGAGAIVLPGIAIGNGAMIAAGAVVDKSVSAGHLYKRSGTAVPIDPARQVQRMRRAI